MFRVGEIFSFFNFGFWIQKFSYWNFWRIENFEIQITCYFEQFLEPRIWEIVPDYIKEVTVLRNLNWKKELWIPENCLCKLYKRFLPQIIFYNMSVAFFMQHFYHFYVIFLFCSWISFESVLYLDKVQCKI